VSSTPAPPVTLPIFRHGKVRETYDLGDKLLMVATDRLSAFDVILPSPIPGKGVLLTQLSRYWLERTRLLVPNHFIGTEITGIVPAEMRPSIEHRAMLVRKAERIDIECVVRGYLAGSGWKEYLERQTLADQPLPAGLRQCERLPEPVFTPALKNDDGHDENISLEHLKRAIGADLSQTLQAMSLALYRYAADDVAARGLILADTKFEFGWIDGELTLIDEAFTPDSSRYWDAATYEPGRDQDSFDKQFVRNWLLESGWNRDPPGPVLPDDVIAGTLSRYRTAFEMITGTTVEQYIESNRRNG
jgi:phosphoribosylaminoimidazole-succinocarboxamide synthase